MAGEEAAEEEKSFEVHDMRPPPPSAGAVLAASAWAGGAAAGARWGVVG